MLNLVEMVTEGVFDQPCKYGHRVEHHAVYCHNDEWIDGPRKCRQSWYYGNEKGHEDKDCPGFKPNPDYKKALRGKEVVHKND